MEIKRSTQSEAMNLLRIAIFALASAGPVYVSRTSLRQPRAHGFWRFWAWEAIAALVVVNAPVWFRAPLAWHQLISWTLLSASLIPLALGLRQLRQARRAEQERSDTALLAFEKTAELVTTGVYRTIRHPMYSSLLLPHAGGPEAEFRHLHVGCAARQHRGVPS